MFALNVSAPVKLSVRVSREGDAATSLVPVQVAFDLFGGVAFFDRFAFVVLFFSFAEADLQLGEAFFVTITASFTARGIPAMA